MKLCWEAEPDDRLSFTKLVHIIFDSITKLRTKYTNFLLGNCEKLLQCIFYEKM